MSNFKREDVVNKTSAKCSLRLLNRARELLADQASNKTTKSSDTLQQSIPNEPSEVISRERNVQMNIGSTQEILNIKNREIIESERTEIVKKETSNIRDKLTTGNVISTSKNVVSDSTNVTIKPKVKTVRNLDRFRQILYKNTKETKECLKGTEEDNLVETNKISTAVNNENYIQTDRIDTESVYSKECNISKTPLVDNSSVKINFIYPDVRKSNSLNSQFNSTLNFKPYITAENPSVLTYKEELTKRFEPVNKEIVITNDLFNLSNFKNLFNIETSKSALSNVKEPQHGKDTDSSKNVPSDDLVKSVKSVVTDVATILKSSNKIPSDLESTKEYPVFNDIDVKCDDEEWDFSGFRNFSEYKHMMNMFGDQTNFNPDGDKPSGVKISEID